MRFTGGRAPGCIIRGGCARISRVSGPTGMTRLIAAVLAVGITTTMSADARQTTQAPARPLNVVVLVIDDIRWDSIGAAGNRIVRTPRIDQLAAEGVRFS